ncbi:hypothetical protein [Chromobacterium piscinae]
MDARYADQLVQAQQDGVEILAYRADLSPAGLFLKKPVAVTL